MPNLEPVIPICYKLLFSYRVLNDNAKQWCALLANAFWANNFLRSNVVFIVIFVTVIIYGFKLLFKNCSYKVWGYAIRRTFITYTEYVTSVLKLIHYISMSFSWKYLFSCFNDKQIIIINETTYKGNRIAQFFNTL